MTPEQRVASLPEGLATLWTERSFVQTAIEEAEKEARLDEIERMDVLLSAFYKARQRRTSSKGDRLRLMGILDAIRKVRESLDALKKGKP